MDFQFIKPSLLKLFISLLCGGLFYFVWMGVFLLTADEASAFVRTIIWLLAPVVTAAGFTCGILLFEQRQRKSQSKFLHILPWPLIGCVIGAGVVYWFGPMLIVFGMFVAAMVSVVLREWYLAIKGEK